MPLKSLFRSWFGPRGPAVRDCVWQDRAACAAGVQGQVGQALDQGHAVLLLLRSDVDLPEFAQGLATRRPRLADDRYAAGDLLDTLAAPGALGLSLVDALRAVPARSRGPARAPLAVHVRARDAQRSQDDRLLELLAPFAPTSVVFHHALDDALLRAHTAQLTPLLQALGLRPDEPIESTVLAQALRRAQRP